MNGALQSRYFEPKLLASVEHLRFTTRRRIEGSYSGRHRSRRRGGAGELADFQEYTDGDDLRRLDWKVLARTGRAYVRLFEDETNFVCTVLIDASGSMSFGAGRRSGALGKLDYVKYFATALSHLVCRQQDQVGLAVVAKGLQDFLSPGGARQHLARFHEVVEKLQPAPATDLAEGLRDLFQRHRQRGVLIVLSDFLVDDLDATFAAVRLFRHRQSEVVILHVVHPDEEALPDGIAYRFEGLEDDGEALGSPGEIQDLYRERFTAHVTSVRTLALAAGCEYHFVSTAVPYMETLRNFLVTRTG